MSAEPFPAEDTSTAATWQHLDDLVSEITNLAQSQSAPRDFWRRLLDRTVRALAAVGGVIWLKRADGRYEPKCQIRASDVPWGSDGAAAERHQQLLAHVGGTRLAITLPPHSTVQDSPADNPSPFLLLLAPVVVEDEAAAIIEVFTPPPDAPAAHQGYLRFLAGVSELAGDFQRQRQLRELRERATTWGHFEHFTEAIHASLDVRRVAYTIANDGRQLVGCDRLSVAVARGRKTRITAISGIDSLDRRAPTVRLLERLLRVVLAIDEPLWYPDEAGLLPPQVESSLSAYLDETHARRLAILPLHTRGDGSRRTIRKPRPIGAVVIEDFTAEASDVSRRVVAATLATQSSTALTNALEYQSLPLVWLWRWVGRFVSMFRGLRLLKTALAVCAVAALIAALILVKVDFTVEGRGELLPERRRDVFAPIDGTIAEIHVTHGAPVKAGQTLFVLRKPELEFELARVTGEMNTAHKRLDTLNATRLGSARSTSDARDEYQQRTAEEQEVKELIKGLEQQLTILNKRIAELTVQSPIDGQVLTWDVSQLLASRPVKQGQILLSIGDTAGPWVLELHVADDRIGHVLEAQHDAQEKLDVSFLLATDPNKSYDAQVRDIAISTDSVGQNEPQVLVTAAVDTATMARTRPGASVLAKIHCGQRAVGYVWLHDLWDAIQTRLLF